MLKCIVPLARGGGYNKGKNRTPYLLSIAGKPLLGHLVDQLLPLKPEEVIFILDRDDKGLMQYVQDNYSFKVRFILQKRSKGSAHAIYGAKDLVDGELVILFGDTFFEADLSRLPSSDAASIIWTYKVERPADLGVVFLDGDRATKLIEKPDSLVSNQAMIGLYYFKHSSTLFNSIEYLLEHDIKTKGSFHLTDAVQLMVNKKKRVKVRVAKDWIDADHGDGLFALNAKLLSEQAKVLGKTDNCVLIKPVHVAKGAVVRDSVLGPHVSVGESSEVVGSVLRDAVVCVDARVSDAGLSHSVVATGAFVKGSLRRVNLDERTGVRLD
ncbi:hypothetical protein GF367_01060 [Candidatus Woesearchaeota archaeon]|nr:hypothetical protein [Candidatus Woesearchaeota archaeon]